MTSHQIIHQLLDSSLYVVELYLSDLSTEELTKRPIPRANHIAYQLGHLILSEIRMVSSVIDQEHLDCSDPRTIQRPSQFDDIYKKDAPISDDPTVYLAKQEYLDIAKAVRAATKMTLDSLSADQLMKPAPEMVRSYAPTVGSVFTTVAAHYYLHAGQIAAFRRHLGKPVLM